MEYTRKQKSIIIFLADRHAAGQDTVTNAEIKQAVGGRKLDEHERCMAVFHSRDLLFVSTADGRHSILPHGLRLAQTFELERRKRRKRIVRGALILAAVSAPVAVLVWLAIARALAKT